MLHRLAGAVESVRTRCLSHLARGEAAAAVAQARRLVGLRPDLSARRLLAVCQLHAGRLQAAVDLARGE